MTQFQAGTRGADKSRGPGATSSGPVSAFLRWDRVGPPASFPSRSMHGDISRPANLIYVLLVADALFSTLHFTGTRSPYVTPGTGTAEGN